MKKSYIPLLAFLLMGSATEYEQAISAFPSHYLEGGCRENYPAPQEITEVRLEMVTKYAWSIITEEAADGMADFVGTKGVVDFGAGSGYIAYLLAKRGINVLAVDNWEPCYGVSCWKQPNSFWHVIETGSYERLRGTSSRVLLLSWPPRRSPMALKALKTWKGDQLIYIGELVRGTADIPFHKELAENWHLVQRIKVPQWWNRSDEVFLFERRVGSGDGWQWIKDSVTRCRKKDL